jgi:streptogramin lyase
LDYKVRPRPTGESAQIVVTEYDISPGHLPGYLVAGNGTDWSLGIPSRVESSVTHDLAWDPRGYAWITDNVTPGRTISKLDPKTGRVIDYKDMSENGLIVNSHDIYVDHLGKIWLANAIDETLDMFDPSTEKFQRFPRPDSVPPGIGRWFDEDSQGNIWQGIQGRPLKKLDPATKMQYVTADPQQPGGAVKLDPRTGKYTFYKALTPALTTYGAVVDAEDNVWFTRTGRDLVDVVDSHTAKVSELNLSARDKDDIEHTALDDELAAKYEPVDEQGNPWQKAPRRQASDKTNGTQWIALSKSSALAKIDIHTRKVTEYPLPYRYSFPYALAVDKNHMVWVGTLNSNSIFKFNPFTEKFTEYPQPSLGADIRCIAVDNSTDPPDVWVAQWQTSKIARVQFREASPTQAAGK